MRGRKARLHDIRRPELMGRRVENQRSKRAARPESALWGHLTAYARAGTTAPIIAVLLHVVLYKGFCCFSRHCS